MFQGALKGVRVVEWGDFVSAPYCGKVMAELGAEVIKVAPRRRERSERRPPFWGSTTSTYCAAFWA